MARSKGEQLYCLEVSLTFLGHSSHNPPVVSSRRDKKDYSDEKKSDSSYFSWYSLSYRDVKMKIGREPVYVQSIRLKFDFPLFIYHSLNFYQFFKRSFFH